MQITQGELAKIFPVSYRLNAETFNKGGFSKIIIEEVLGQTYAPKSISEVVSQVWRYNNSIDRIRYVMREMREENRLSWWRKPFTVVCELAERVARYDQHPDIIHIPLDHNKFINLHDTRIMSAGDVIYITLHSANVLSRGMHAITIQRVDLHVHEGVGRITYILNAPEGITGSMPTIQWDEEKGWYNSNYSYWNIHLTREAAIEACRKMMEEDRKQIQSQMEK